MDFALIEKTLRPQYHSAQKKKKMSYVGISPQAYFQFIQRIDVILIFNHRMIT